LRKADSDGAPLITNSHSNGGGRLEIEEKGSVLLEVHVCSNDSESVPHNFQWLVDGAPLQESAGQNMSGGVHTNTTKSILCISNADLEMHGSKYSCEVTVTSSNSAIQTCGVTLGVRSPLDKYTASLASMYSAWPKVPEDTGLL
jgi:hypothetical protein